MWFNVFKKKSIILDFIGFSNEKKDHQFYAVFLAFHQSCLTLRNQLHLLHERTTIYEAFGQTSRRSSFIQRLRLPELSGLKPRFLNIG